MLDPDNKIDTNSTWEALPRRPLLLKFIASLMLLGFLVGLMLGKLRQPQAPQIARNTVEQLATYTDGLRVCLRTPASIQAGDIQGSYQVLLADTTGRAARGELTLAGGEKVVWQLQPQADATQVIFTGLQPLVGQWHVNATAEPWCVDLQIKLAQTAEALP